MNKKEIMNDLKLEYEQFKNNKEFIESQNFKENTKNIIFSILNKKSEYLEKVNLFYSELKKYSEQKNIKIEEKTYNIEEVVMRRDKEIKKRESNNPSKIYELILGMDKILTFTYNLNDKSISINIMETSNKNGTNLNLSNGPKFKNSGRYMLKKIIDTAKENNKTIIDFLGIDKGAIGFYKKIFKELKEAGLVKNYKLEENKYSLIL